MASPAPAEIVRLLFEARMAGDLRRLCALLDPEIDAVTYSGEHYHGIDDVRSYLAAEGATTEVLAQRIEADGDGSVIARGRVRIHGKGSLADSPAAWRLTVRDGRVATIEALKTSAARAAA